MNQRAVPLVMLPLLLLSVAGRGVAADQPPFERGQKVYQYWCSSCHGPGEKGMFGSGLPGTLALRIKYNGAEPPVLEDRTDLSPQTVKYVVRHGIQAMPFFRKTEVSDADLDAIAAYLARNNP